MWFGWLQQRAEPALIPDSPLRDVRTGDGAGRIDYAAPARLINDNLLDLSHIAYVHTASFAEATAPSDKVGSTPIWTFARLIAGYESGLAAIVMCHRAPQPSERRGIPQDVFTSYDFLVPVCSCSRPSATKQAHANDWRGRSCGSAQSLFSTFTCQAVTPLGADTARYFFAYGPWAKEASRKSFFAELGLKAFEEDRRMIEAQYRVIAQTENPRMMPMVMDKAVRTYEGVLKRLHKEEAVAPTEEISLRKTS